MDPHEILRLAEYASAGVLYLILAGLMVKVKHPTARTIALLAISWAICDWCRFVAILHVAWVGEHWVYHSWALNVVVGLRLAVVAYAVWRFPNGRQHGRFG